MRNIPPCPICKSGNTQYHTSKSDMYWCRDCNNAYDKHTKKTVQKVISGLVFRLFKYTSRGRNK